MKKYLLLSIDASGDDFVACQWKKRPVDWHVLYNVLNDIQELKDYHVIQGDQKPCDDVKEPIPLSELNAIPPKPKDNEKDEDEDDDEYSSWGQCITTHATICESEAELHRLHAALRWTHESLHDDGGLVDHRDVVYMRFVFEKSSICDAKSSIYSKKKEEKN
jgi:hypothetical protein